jgi:hypothetical protein
MRAKRKRDRLDRIVEDVEALRQGGSKSEPRLWVIAAKLAVAELGWHVRNHVPEFDGAKLDGGNAQKFAAELLGIQKAIDDISSSVDRIENLFCREVERRSPVVNLGDARELRTRGRR